MSQYILLFFITLYNTFYLYNKKLKKVNYCNTFYLIYLSINFPQDTTVNMGLLVVFVDDRYRLGKVNPSGQLVTLIALLPNLAPRNRPLGYFIWVIMAELFPELSKTLPTDIPHDQKRETSEFTQWVKESCGDLKALLDAKFPDWPSFFRSAQENESYTDEDAMRDVVWLLLAQASRVKLYPLSLDEYHAKYEGHTPHEERTCVDPYTGVMYCMDLE